MKKFFKTFSLITFFFLIFFFSKTFAEPSISKDDLNQISIQGKAPSLEQSGLKLLLIDFWASWCEPCKKSLRLYMKNKTAWEKKGIYIYTISADEELSAAKKFLKENKITLPMGWDKERKLTRKLGIDAIPVLIAMDRDGKIIGKKQGFPDGKASHTEELVLTWLKQKN